MKTRARFIAVALFSCLPGAGAALAFDDPINALMGPHIGDTACFTRSYAPEFLARHPRQRVDQVEASFYVGKSGADSGRWYWMSLREKGQASPFYLIGGCSWTETFDRAPGNPSQKKTWAGDACNVSVGLKDSDRPNKPDDLRVDIAKDGQSVTIHAGTYVSALTGAPGHWKRQRLDLGRDDRVFRLQRVDAATCQPRNAGLDTLE